MSTRSSKRQCVVEVGDLTHGDADIGSLSPMEATGGPASHPVEPEDDPMSETSRQTRRLGRSILMWASMTFLIYTSKLVWKSKRLPTTCMVAVLTLCISGGCDVSRDAVHHTHDWWRA